METEIEVIGQTDKTVRFTVIVDGTSTGELQMNRDEATKFWEKTLGKGYKVVSKKIL